MRWGTIREFINKCVVWLSADWFVALCSLLGVLSFVASVYAAIKARSIDKTLSKYKVQQQFKESQSATLQKIEGYIEIIKLDELSPESIPDIVCTISSIKHSYSEILSIPLRFRIFCLLKYLNCPYNRIKKSKLANQLGYLEGALSKKEV